MDTNAQVSPTEKLTNLADEAAKMTVENSFMTPGQTRKRGRPKKNPDSSMNQGPKMSGGDQAARTGPQVDPIAELMPLTMGLASFYSNMLVQIAEDKRAALPPEKAQVIAHASAVCLNQYLPGALGQHASAIVLAVTVLETTIYAIRLRKENLAKLREEYQRRNGPKVNDHQQNGAAGPGVFPQ